MITNNGVELISKFLVGQASSYASHIAIGSGARPTSNSQPITVAASGVTVGTVTGSGPYSATLTLTGTSASDYWSYLQVGDIVTATPGTGSLGSGTVTVSAINSAKQITVSSTATMTAGAGLTNVKVSSSLTSQSLSDKSSLDFEIARFPIISRSYVVEKQIVNPSLLKIISPTEVTVTISSGHPFGIGDEVNIQGINIGTNPEVQGIYKITAISSTTFTASVYDPTIVTGWDAADYLINYIGFAYNGNLFNATVFTKQVSLTAEMSDTLQYDISELGLYSLGSNQYSPSSNSRMLLDFTTEEGWQYFASSTSSFEDITTPTLARPIGAVPIYCSANDSYWNTNSPLRQEKPRILSDAIILPGALSDWNGSTFTTSSDYLVLTNPGIDLSKSSASDEVRLAFSIMNAVDTPSALPTSLIIRFEFLCSNGIDSGTLTFTDSGTTIIKPNRYQVLSKNISDISITSGFDWAKVTSVKVYSTIENVSGTASDDYAVVLDGLRFENVGTENPLYALTAYTIVNNTTASKISKQANSNDLINFRIDLAVGK